MDFCERLYLKLKDKTVKTLKNQLESLGIASTTKKDIMAKKLANYLSTPEGRKFGRNLEDYNFLFEVSENSKTACLCGEPGDQTLECIRCKNSYHRSCMNNMERSTFACPECQLRDIHILNQFREFILRPFIVYTSSAFNDRATYSFRISAEMRERILREEMEIQVRCICLQKDTHVQKWPRYGILLVNGKIAMEFHTASNPNAHERKDKPVNITTLVLNNPENSVRIIQVQDTNSYVAAVLVIKKLSVDQLTDQIRNKGPIPIPHTKELIRKEMQTDSDGLRISRIRVSLLCFYSMRIIDIPARGSLCTHSECFDLKMYLTAQEHSLIRRWKCPICRKPCVSISIDDYFIQILKDARKVKDVKGVEFPSENQFGFYTIYQNNFNQGEEIVID